MSEQTLPEVTVRPCNDCPWRKKAAQGWLGPYDAQTWVQLALSDEPIACHETIVEDDNWEGARQCAGAANFRANIAKLSRNPECARGEKDEDVFSSPRDFIAYHDFEED